MAARISEISAAPPRSRRTSPPPPVSGTTFQPRSRVTAQTGKVTRKIARHPRSAGFHWISAPPLNWPIAAAMPIMMP